MIHVVAGVTILSLDSGEQTKMLICFDIDSVCTALLSDMRPEIVPVVIIVSVTVKKVVT